MRFKVITVLLTAIEAELAEHATRGWCPSALTLLPGKPPTALIILSTSRRFYVLRPRDVKRVLALIAHRTPAEALQLVAQEFHVTLEEAQAHIDRAERLQEKAP